MSFLWRKYSFFIGFLGVWQAFSVINEEGISNKLNGKFDNEEKALTLWDSRDFIKVDKEDGVPTCIDVSLFQKIRSDQKKQKLRNGYLYTYDPKCLSEVFNGYFTEESYLRALHVYVPDDLSEESDPGKGYYFPIHGTGAFNNPDYYDDSTCMYQAILDYAAMKGDESKTVMHMLPFRWNGKLNDKERTKAADNLVLIINALLYAEKKKKSKGKYFLGAFMHSHGCNVGFKAANNLIDAEFDEMIAVAPVVLEDLDWSYSIHHAKKVFPIVSELDFVAPMGQKLAYAKQWLAWEDANTCDKWSNFCNRTKKCEDESEECNDKEEITDEDTLSHYKDPLCWGLVTHIWLSWKNVASSHSQTATYFAGIMSQVMPLLYKYFTYKDKVRNVALDVMPERTMEDRFNLSLYPRTDKEKELYYKLLPSKMLDLSKQNDKKHLELYGYAKGQMSRLYWLFKGIWKMRHDI